MATGRVLRARSANRAHCAETLVRTRRARRRSGLNERTNSSACVGNEMLGSHLGRARARLVSVERVDGGFDVLRQLGEDLFDRLWCRAHMGSLPGAPHRAPRH